MVEPFIQINQNLPIYLLAVPLCETRISHALNYVDFFKKYHQFGIFLQQSDLFYAYSVSCRFGTTVVGSGRYNKIPHTAWLINSRDIFLTVLQSGSLRSECQLGQARAFLLVQSQSLLAVSSCGGGGEGPLWRLFYRNTSSSHEGSTLKGLTFELSFMDQAPLKGPTF